MAISKPLGDPGPDRPDSPGRLDSGTGARGGRFEPALELAEGVLGKLALRGLFLTDHLNRLEPPHVGLVAGHLAADPLDERPEPGQADPALA